MSARRRLIWLALFLGVSLWPAVVSADVLDDLRERLQDSRKKLQEVESKVEAYRTRVREQQSEARTLRGQIRILDDQLVGLKLELDRTVAEGEKVNADIAAVAEEIRRVEEAVNAKRAHLREELRVLQVLNAASLVENFFKYASLSGVLSETRALERLQQSTQRTLADIKDLRRALGEKAQSLGDLERELSELKERQELQVRTLSDQQQVKERLYEVTKDQEARFQGLLEQAAAEQRRANAQIAAIEAEVRAELARRGITRLGGVGAFDFPIDPIFGISCGFHCPDYPYRHLLGPHAGIDMPTHVGTPVRASADGYVARARDAGGPGYSYVLLLHGDDFSTVYGHLSNVAAQEGVFLSRGQVLGSSGGIPGTRGAGLSTGPHLHFEVRRKGIPVDPARYLP